MKLSTKKLCRAGIIAALYFAFTACFGSLAYGPLQIRPAEALTILPLFFPEAIPGLFIGCMLSNLFSGYGLPDIVFGSLITLLASVATYFSGKFLKNTAAKLVVGGAFPVLLNAFGVPLIILLTGGIDGGFTAYLICVAEFLLTQTIWIYGLGTPLYLVINRQGQAGVKFLL